MHSAVTEALDPIPLLRFLEERGVKHIVIGGFAVNAHGFIRVSKDLDIVPDPSGKNLEKLASALRELNAGNAEGGDFEDGEFPLDPTSVDDLIQGGNFRLETDLGELDIMQWIAGLDADNPYAELAEQALEGQPEGINVLICSLAHLRAMKQAAGRPRDLDDLEHLPDV
ncbi:MAG: hypothetical protein WAU42_10340 [Solirubrobacteraceae bacterium]